MSNDQLSRENNEDITNDELQAAVAEIIYNGELINWEYWASRQKINPRQAAILAHGIDPIKWQDGEFKSGAWPADLHSKIQRLHEWLAERSDFYTFQQLVAVLGGDFASFLMKEAATSSVPHSITVANEEWYAEQSTLSTSKPRAMEECVEQKLDLSWQDRARLEADKLHLRDVKAGAWSSVADIADRVATILRDAGVHGPRGPLRDKTILREALQGNRWKRPPGNSGETGK